MYASPTMAMGMPTGASSNIPIGFKPAFVINPLITRFVEVLITETELVKIAAKATGINNREGDIPAETREDERNFQNLLVERGGVHIDDVVVRLAAASGPAIPQQVRLAPVQVQPMPVGDSDGKRRNARPAKAARR